MTDDYSSERGSSRTWVDAEIAGGLMAAQRGGDSPPVRAGAADLGFEPNLQREADLVLLRALGEDTTSSFVGGLTEGERTAFENMLTLLVSPHRQHETLSPNQRAWAVRRAQQLEIDLRDPAERNRNVPRGREVAPAAVLQTLPKAPPGRRTAVDDLPLFAPAPPLPEPGPFEGEAGRAVTGQPLPTRAPDTTSRRPSAGVVGARRRPSALGRPK